MNQLFGLQHRSVRHLVTHPITNDSIGVYHIFLSGYIRDTDIVGTIDVHRPNGDVLYYYFIFLCHIYIDYKVTLYF